MADPLENGCEQLTRALLIASADLTAIIPAADIVREAEDGGASKDRIICIASKREVAEYGRTPAEILVWKVPVDVTLRLTTRSVQRLNTALAAIADAMNTAPTGDAATLVIDWKIREVNDTDEGEVATEDNTRIHTKRYWFFTEPVEEMALIFNDGAYFLLNGS